MAEPARARPGYVLLHGAMLGGWIWDRVVPLLPQPALAVDLRGRGSKPANVTSVTLDDAVDSVVADIEAWPGGDRVILVAHSLSGILVPPVASRLGDRAVQAVFVSAAVPTPGHAYLDVLPSSQRLLLRVVLQLQKRGPLTPKWAARRALCNDLDESTTALVLERLTREAPRLYSEPVRAEIPARLPVLYVRTTRDRGFGADVQDRMLASLQHPRVEEIEAGHLPMLGRPEQLAAILRTDAVE